MPAVYYSDDGTREYYFPPPLPPPPPPPPPKTGTNAPGFQHDVTVANQATGDHMSGGSTTKTEVENDWAAVGGIIATQYEIAWTSANPKDAVAALDRQYKNYFRNNGDTTIYKDVVAPAKHDVQYNETDGQRRADVQYYNAESEPAGSKRTADIETAAIAVTKADINAELQKFGKGDHGVYTVAQIKAAAAAVLGQVDPKSAPLVDFVATDMEEGQSLSDVLSVLQTKGLKLTPADIKAEALGTLKLTPAEIKSGTLILTPAEAQIAKIDPLTLAFLKADGITVTQLSPEMAQLAKESSSLFAFMEVNGVNITTVNGAGANSTAYRLGSGNYLSVTVNGKAFDVNYLGSDKKPVTPGTVVSAYEYYNATNPGQGIVAVANMLLPQLTVNENTLATDPKLGDLAILVQKADTARSQLAGGQLKILMGAAPGAANKNAPGYIGNTVNPFVTTQLNGFFNPAARQAFWSKTAQPLLQPYLQTGLGAQFKNGNLSLMNAGRYARQALAGASPEEAKMMISLVEGQVNKFNLAPQGLPLPAQPLLSALGQAVQIADQMPNSDGTNAATQVANWLNSGGPQIRLLQGAGGNLYYDAAEGNYDLANAIVNSIESLGGGRNLYKYTVELGGIIADNVQRGQQAYDTSIQNEIGAQNYAIFEKNKDNILKAYFNQFADDPNIGHAQALSSLSNTALDDIIGKTMNLTPTDQAAAKASDYTKNWYAPNAANPSSTQNSNTIQLLQQWIRSQSSANSTITALPIIYASDTEGIVNSGLFEINTPGHQYERGKGYVAVTNQTVIDGSAALDALSTSNGAPVNPNDVSVQWHYSSIADFQQNNQYSGGDIYQLVTQNGHVSYQDMAAHVTTLGQRISGGVGDVLNVAAAASLFVPGLDVVAFAAVAYDLVRNGVTLAKEASDGESINPFSNGNVSGQWISTIGDVAALGNMGIAKAVEGGFGWASQGGVVDKIGKAAGFTAAGIGAQQTVAVGVNLIENGGSMNSEQLTGAFFSLAAGMGQVALGSIHPHQTGGDPAPTTVISGHTYEEWAADGRPADGTTAAVFNGAEETLYDETWGATGGAPTDTYWQEAVSHFQPDITGRAEDLAGGPGNTPTTLQTETAQREYTFRIVRRASERWEQDDRPGGVNIEQWRTAYRKFESQIAYSYRVRQAALDAGGSAYKAWVKAGRPPDADFDAALAQLRPRIDERAEQLAGGPGHTPTAKQTAEAEAEFGPQIGAYAHDEWSGRGGTTSGKTWDVAQKVFQKLAWGGNDTYAGNRAYEKWVAKNRPTDVYFDAAVTHFQSEIDARAGELAGPGNSPTAKQRAQAEAEFGSQIGMRARHTKTVNEAYTAWVAAGKPADVNFDAAVAHFQPQIDARAEQLAGGPGHTPTTEQRAQAEADFGSQIGEYADMPWRSTARWTRAEQVFQKRAGDYSQIWQTSGRPMGPDTDSRYWGDAKQQIKRNVALSAHQLWADAGRPREPSGLFWRRDATSNWRQADNDYDVGAQSADLTLSNARTAANDTYSAATAAPKMTFESALDASYQAWKNAGEPRLTHWKDALNDPKIRSIDDRANDLWVQAGSPGAGPDQAMRTLAETAYGRDIATAAFELWIKGNKSPSVKFYREWTPARQARDTITQAEQARDNVVAQAEQSSINEGALLAATRDTAIADSYQAWDARGKPGSSLDLRRGYWHTAERDVARSPLSAPRTAREALFDFRKKWWTHATDPDTTYRTQARRYLSQGKSIGKTLGKWYGITNLAGAAAWAMWYPGMRNFRNGQRVTAATAYTQLQQLQANPDRYMEQHYHSDAAWFIPVEESKVEAVNRTGHLFEIPDSSGKPLYFRRVPQDLFNALQQSHNQNVSVKDGQVFVTETLPDSKNKVTVEIVPPGWDTKSFTESTHSGPGPRYDLNFALGPVEGDQMHLNLELNLGDRYSAPNVTTVRLGAPSNDQGWQLGIRQQNTTYFSDVTLSMGTMEFNAAQALDLTDKGSVFSGNEWMLGNFRAYWYIGNRNREELNATGSSAFVRLRETGFSEMGLGADFVKFYYGGSSNNYVSLNGYYELQLYAPDFRDQADLGDGLITNSSQNMQPVPPLFLIDPALQITATSQLPYTPYEIPRLVNLPYLSPSS